MSNQSDLITTLQSETVVVPMDGVSILHYGSRKPYIGTRNLNGCTCVVIMSRSAIILPHIPPRPDMSSRDLYAGDRHFTAKVREIQNLFYANRNAFDAGSTA